MINVDWEFFNWWRENKERGEYIGLQAWTEFQEFKKGGSTE